MDTRQVLPVPADFSGPKPAFAPRRASNIGALAAGSWTEITAIYGPSEAAYGDTVDIAAYVKNLGSYGFYIAANGQYNGTGFVMSPVSAGVDPGASQRFAYSFTMPNKDITLQVWSYYWTGSDWVEDDHKSVVITLKALPSPEFSGFGVTDYSKT